MIMNVIGLERAKNERKNNHLFYSPCNVLLIPLKNMLEQICFTTTARLSYLAVFYLRLEALKLLFGFVYRLGL